MGRTLILLYLHKSLPEQLSNTETFFPTPLSLDDPNYMSNSIEGDSYLVLARRWLEKGFIEQVKVIAIRYPHNHPRYSPQGIYDLGSGMMVYVLPNTEQYQAVNQTNPEDILFIRGQSSWEAILKLYSDNFKIFYNGSSTEHWKPRWPVNVILVDDPSRKLEGVRCFEFTKFADETIFRPLGLEKRYDLCFIGTFAQRDKKGQLEFARLANKKRKAVFVGEHADVEAVKELRHIWPSCEIAGLVSKKQVNEILNRSKVSVVYSRANDAAPRVIVESLASGTPVLIHKRNIGRKYITARAGEVASTLSMRWKLRRMLISPDGYDPAGEYNRRYASKLVARQLWDNLSVGGRLDAFKISDQES